MHLNLISGTHAETHICKYEHRYNRGQRTSTRNIPTSMPIRQHGTNNTSHKMTRSQNLKEDKIFQELWGIPHAYENLDLVTDRISSAI